MTGCLQVRPLPGAPAASGGRCAGHRVTSLTSPTPRSAQRGRAPVGDRSTGIPEWAWPDGFWVMLARRRGLGHRQDGERQSEEGPPRGGAAVPAGRRARGRHGRSVATQAAAGPVPPVQRGVHPGVPDHRRLAGRHRSPTASAAIARAALEQFSTRKVNEADWAAFAADPGLRAAGRGRGRPARRRWSGRSRTWAARAGACTI